MSALRYNVKAAPVPGELVAGKPDISLLCDEAEEKKADPSDGKTGGRKDRQQVSDGVRHPDGAYRLASDVEGGLDAQVNGVDQHPVKVPDAQCHGQIQLPLSLVAVKDLVQFFAPAARDTILQPGQLFR